MPQYPQAVKSRAPQRRVRLSKRVLIQKEFVISRPRTEGVHIIELVNCRASEVIPSVISRTRDDKRHFLGVYHIIAHVYSANMLNIVREGSDVGAMLAQYKVS